MFNFSLTVLDESTLADKVSHALLSSLLSRGGSLFALTVFYNWRVPSLLHSETWHPVGLLASTRRRRRRTKRSHLLQPRIDIAMDEDGCS